MQPAVGRDGKAVVAGRAEGADVGADFFIGAEVFEDVEARQRRLLLERAHVGEDHAVVVFDRIPGLARHFEVAPAVGLAGLAKAVAFDVEEPAVIAAGDALFGDFAVEERGAAMHAARIEQAGAAALVAEEDQILAEDADVLRAVRHVRGDGDGLPVAPHEFATRRAGADLSEFVIGMLRGPAVGAAVGRPLSLRRFAHFVPPVLGGINGEFEETAEITMVINTRSV